MQCRSRSGFLALSCLVGLVGLVWTAASGCYQEPKTPPGKVSEVPIDTESSRREAKRPDPNEGEEVVAPPPELAEGSEGGGAAPAAGGGGGGSAGGKVAPITPNGAGARMNKAMCDQMLDKYVELVIAGGGSPLKGTTGKELENARNMIKSMVSQDPNFQGFQKACLRDGTKAQHACAMAARHAEEFQNCIR